MPLEPHTRTNINLRLINLGWNLNQKDPNCNVFQEQAKLSEQNKLLKGKRPDYVLYESGTNKPIAVIEAKKPSGDLNNAINQAIDLYANPLEIPLVFAFNDTFVVTQHAFQNKPLKIDGEELQDFIDQSTALRFVNEGAEILSAPSGLNLTREQLMVTLNKINNFLRKSGLREGFERFSAFAEILFLKLIDEFSLTDINKAISSRFMWSKFYQKYQNDEQELLDFVSGKVWQELQSIYGDVFSQEFSLKTPQALKGIMDEIHHINFTSTDTDVKGDAFEYFLKTVTNGNKDLGEYFTPRHIVRTMVKLIKPGYGETIYDPFCGTGGFLLEAFKYLNLRIDASNEEIKNWTKTKALFGREMTSTARIAKMNMILFGDGHTNIQQMDSLKNPVNEKYNIVLSNIPYSQNSDFGSLYGVDSKNADAICMHHIWRSLKPGGRAAVIVPETFLYEDGIIGSTREMLVRGCKSFDVISLPRGVFMPYTPTKTNILLFEKGGHLKSSYFFAVINDGFELNTKRKPVQGASDIKLMLSSIEEKPNIPATACLVNRKEIQDSGNWNLRPFYYMEDIPESTEELVYLSDNILVEANDLVDPNKFPDKEWGVIEVSQKGIFLNEFKMGEEFNQKYKVVRAGDIVYNPHRVNIGSIGVVPSFLDGYLTSSIYVVARVVNKNFPASYIVSILKLPRYLEIIMKYCTSASRASLTFDSLIRIKIPKLSQPHLKQLLSLEKTLNKHIEIGSQAQSEISSIASTLLSISNRERSD